MSDELRKDLEQAAAEQPAAETSDRPRESAESLYTRVHDAVKSWDANMLSEALKAYPRVQHAKESGALEGVILRGIAKAASLRKGWVRFLTGDALEDVLSLNEEIQQQERAGEMPKYEPPVRTTREERTQVHSETMQKLDKLEALLGRTEQLALFRAKQRQGAAH